MKQQLISRLVVGALAAIAANAAFAGQIQSSSVSIAREAITDDAQAVTSPRISYRFAGDVDARSQNQTFQVQFTLENGALWSSAGLAQNIQVTDGVTGTVIAQAAAPAATVGYNVDTLALSSDKKTLFATITVWKDTNATPISLIKQPLISISTGTVAQNPTVKNLFTVAGVVAACDNTVKTLPVNFKHYVALANGASLATDTTATADEHTRGGATNRTTLITFPTNIAVKVTKSGGNAKLDVTANNTLFAGSAVAVAPAFDSWISTTKVNLGRISLTQQSNGYDADLANVYALTNVASATGVVTAAQLDGRIESSDVKVTITNDQGFAVGSSIYLAATPGGAAIAGTTKTFATAAAAAANTVTITLANGTQDIIDLASATGLYVVYQVPGGAVQIPASTFNVSAATVEKAAEGGTAPTLFAEQPETCNGPLFSLGGSIKIDVRNYAATARTDGWLSVLRLINTSENRTATVYAQYIGADGKYGNWGKLTTLAPRASQNLTPDAVNAALTNAPAAPTATDNATSSVPVTTAAGDAPRLRITTTDGNTLRVQNYLYNPASKNFIEASGSQGVDFTFTADRALVNSQNTEQDAQAGINQGN